jgi:hypothetical protein
MADDDPYRKDQDRVRRQGPPKPGYESDEYAYRQRESHDSEGWDPPTQVTGGGPQYSRGGGSGCLLILVAAAVIAGGLWILVKLLP